MIPFRREKLASQLIREVSDILRREMKDPRLGFVTLLRAAVSSDFKYAKLMVSILGPDKNKKATMAALQHATGFVQHELSRRLKMRQCPAVVFVRDDSLEKAFKVTKLIDQLSKQRQEGAAGESE